MVASSVRAMTVTYVIPGQVGHSAHELLDAVRAGRTDTVGKLLDTLTPAERRDCVPVLKAWRKSLRASGDDLPVDLGRSLLLAGACCCTGAADAAQWLADRELRWAAGPDRSFVVEALRDRDPKWLGQVVRRLAARRAVAESEYELIAALVLAAGCEPPTTDGFVLGWESSIRVGGEDTGDRLRADPFVTAMVPRLFEVPGTGTDFQYSLPDDPGWPRALAGLAEEGVLDRGMLIDGCLSKLLGPERMGVVRGFLELLAALDPTEDERAARTATWVGMVPDTHALAAARAQETLAGLDEAGRLGIGHLIEASRAALFRPEKKIVRVQLALLDRAMKRDPARTDELLPVAADGFGHQEHSLQERALALVVRHHRRASGAVRAELAEKARLLSPGLRRRAAETFGAAVAGQEEGVRVPEADVLPPVPSAERLAPVPTSPAVLAAEVGAVLRGDDTPARREEALNGLVTWFHTDPAALRTALESVVAQQDDPPLWGGARVVSDLEFVLLSVMGTASEQDAEHVRHRALEHQCPHSAPRAAGLARAAEIGARMARGDALPFLLATPTWATGTIDPTELVRRLAAYEGAGVVPGEADFLQALFRLDREVSAEAVTASARLTSPAGRRLADRLASGPLPDPAVFRETERLRLRTPRPGVLVRVEAAEGHADLPEPFRSLLAAHDPVGNPCACGGGVESSPHILAVLPQHREILAARMLTGIAVAAEFDNRGVGATALPALAESGGPAGPATHLALAYGLGARGDDERVSAVDALLTLAAAGALDAERLGRDLAELTRLRRLKPQRFVAALRTAVAPGAVPTVWGVLSAALPPLLAGDPPQGLLAVLTLAAECAERSSAGGAIPGVDGLAGRPGSSQLVKQARRIQAATGDASRAGTG
ncbi:hypothetical protein GCM10010504_05870 [Streptomyces griseus]|nr:hypothetical protein GCM10010504_05870 [Streptomyces griseus]